MVVKTKRPVKITKTRMRLKPIVKRLGFFGQDPDLKYDENVKTVTINGEPVTFYSQAMLDYQKTHNPRSWEIQRHHYKKITPKWYIMTYTMSNGKWANLAGLKVFDYAVPWEWQKKNQAELNRRGGAVWWYDGDRRFGEPLFYDDIQKMALKHIKAHVPK